MHFRLFLLPALLSIFGCLFAYTSCAQLNENFTPLSVYDETDAALIQSLRLQLREELNRQGPEKVYGVSGLYTKNTEHLVKLVKAKRIVKNDELQGFVDAVFQDLVSNTALTTAPIRVLIAKLPSSNAMCIGEGTFLITTGLLGRIENESQLAFTLAHEIAHYELGHIKEGIQKKAKSKYSRKLKKGFTRVLSTDDVEESDLDSLRKMVYDMSRFSRTHEREADSLGLLIAWQAGYNTAESIAMLSVLDSLDYSKHKLGYAVFTEFQFSKFPFQDRWLEPRNSYPDDDTEGPRNVFIFSLDSIRSHPDIAMRRQWLQQSQVASRRPVNKHPSTYVDGIITLAEFEDLQTAYAVQRLDYAMLMALQLKAHYPANRYLTSVISKIFIDLCTDKALQTLLSYATSYRGELKFVNAFLSNLTPEEIGEIAFNFLNSQNNFNKSDPEHYYLLWKICELTNRENVQARINESFAARFDRTKYRRYYDLMRD